jgi:hypothetical protein
MAKRQRTMATIAKLRARGDSRGAARLVPAVTAEDNRLGALNHQAIYGNGCSNVTNPVINALPYNSRFSNGAYGYSPTSNGSYGHNPTVNALTTIALPMLKGIH